MRTRQIISALLVALLLLPGCSSGGAGQPSDSPPTDPGTAAPAPAAGPDSPAPDTPNPAPATSGDTPASGGTAERLDPNCALTGDSYAPLDISGTFGRRGVWGATTCHFTIDTGRLQVYAGSVLASDAEEALAAIKVDGARVREASALPRRYTADDKYWTVRLNLAGGAVGEEITVSLTPEPGDAPWAAVLVREQPPTLRMLVAEEGGDFRPLVPGESLPEGPKRIRFEVEGTSIDEVQFNYHSAQWAKLRPDQSTRVSETAMEVTLADPHGLVEVWASGRTNKTGALRLPPVAGHFYIGTPPTLVAVRPDAELATPGGAGATAGAPAGVPSTGEAEEVLGPAPPDVLRAAASPDGRYLALVTLTPYAIDGQTVWLADLTTGTLVRTPFQADIAITPGWDARGRLVAPMEWGTIGMMHPATGVAEIQESAATFWGPISPDGRTIAGRVGAPQGFGTGGWVGPPRADQLVIRDLMTDTEHAYPWHEYWGGLHWLESGELVLITVTSNQEPSLAPGPETEPRYYTVNLETGEWTPREPLPPGWKGAGSSQTANGEAAGGPYKPERPDDHFLTWLPDGRALLLRWENWANRRYPPGP